MSESQLPEQIALDTARLFTVPALSSGPATTTPSSIQPNQLASGVPWATQATLQELTPDYLGHAEAAAYLASQQQQRQQQQHQQQLPMQTMLGTGEASPPPPKKRGRPSGSSKASRDGAPEDRASSIQEKNRQAQARFRERQKEKMCILEARVHELEARNKQLMDEMRALDGRKSVLEKVLSMKDEKIQQLENGATILNSVCMDRAKDMPPPCIPAPGNLVEIRPEGQAVAATRGQDLVSQWKQHVEKLSGLLLGLAKGECLEELTGPQIDEIMTAAFRLFRGSCISDPLAAQTLISTSLNAADMNVAEKPDHWQSVVGAMALSEAQVQAVQRLTLQFKAKMVALWNSRESFSSLAITGPTELTSCRLLAARTLKAADILTRLQGAMLLETREHFDYVAAVLDEVLTKRQLANACAASYPYFPDPLTFCNLLESPAARPDFQ